LDVRPGEAACTFAARHELLGLTEIGSAIVSTVKTVSGVSTRTMKDSCEPKILSAFRIICTERSLSGKYLPKLVCSWSFGMKTRKKTVIATTTASVSQA